MKKIRLENPYFGGDFSVLPKETTPNVCCGYIYKFSLLLNIKVILGESSRDTI